MIISALQQSRLTALIKEESSALGFYACGISAAQHLPEDEEKVEAWLEENLHGEMSWMERNKEKRYNPALLVPGSKSVITVLYNYKPKEKLQKEGNFQISSYAYGKDYHKVLKDKLHQLLLFIKSHNEKCHARVFVDSAPVLDRAWANKSGLGFIGKNTMLINRKGGSYFFIGHIIIDLELDYEKEAKEKNFCGSCTLCLKACPTDALEPFKLNATKCISYLTIEHKSEIPQANKNLFDDWIFGCDICQDVCPWNREALPNDETLFDPSAALKVMNKESWYALDEIKFNSLFHGTAVERAGYAGLKRNINYLKD